MVDPRMSTVFLSDGDAWQFVVLTDIQKRWQNEDLIIWYLLQGINSTRKECTGSQLR